MTYASGHGVVLSHFTPLHMYALERLFLKGLGVFWLGFFFEAEVRNCFVDYSGVSRYSSPCFSLRWGSFPFPFQLILNYLAFLS